eukprot:2536536-Rhodomonas_salina.3
MTSALLPRSWSEGEREKENGKGEGWQEETGGRQRERVKETPATTLTLAGQWRTGPAHPRRKSGDQQETARKGSGGRILTLRSAHSVPLSYKFAAGVAGSGQRIAFTTRTATKSVFMGEIQVFHGTIVPGEISA